MTPSFAPPVGDFRLPKIRTFPEVVLASWHAFGLNIRAAARAEPCGCFVLMPTTCRFTSLLVVFAACFAVGLGVPAQAQLNSQEDAIFNLLGNASGQGRHSTAVDPILSSVARERARDLAQRGYFSHTNPDGHGPNYLVRQAGYALPAHYDQSAAGNNIESIAAGYTTPQSTWNGWMDSPGHKRHLLAESSFYVEQTAVGVGYYYDANSEYRHYWVVLTAPPVGPALAISSPAANARLLVPQTTIAGATSGSPVAARVVVRLENAAGIGEFRNAAGSKNWTLAVTNLAPGTNTVRVRSLDANGGILKEATRTFRYAVLSPLLVEVDGSGSVAAGFLGTTQRELGMRYTITAKPATGWLFDRWSGSVEGTSAALSFTMEQGFALTAHFRENPFYARRGAYNGLVQAAPATHATSGFFKATTTTTGSVSGRLVLGGKAYGFSGKFDAEGVAQLTVKRGPLLPPLVFALQLDLEGGTDRITGTISDGSFTATLSADQALPAGSTHFAAGRYTVRLPATTTDPPETIPPGDGFGLLKVGPTGATRLTGMLADGRAFSHTATISQDGRLPIYVSLFAGTGSLAGSAIVSGDGATLAGSTVWHKPARLKDRSHPAAFATTLGIAGARYIVPQAGTPALAVPEGEANSALQLSDGDLGQTVDQPATLLANNRVLIPAPELPRLTLSITASTGRVTGSFTHPVTNQATRISGVILQNENAARGFFLGPRAGGAARFVATP